MEQYVKISFSGGPYDRSKVATDIESEIKKGGLPVGSKLPPVRVLAHQLGISKNTVQAAYEELVSRAVVKNVERKGFYVDESFVAKSSESPFINASLPNLISTDFGSRPKLGKHIVNMSGVFIDPDLLPKDKIIECFKSVLNTPGLHVFHDTQGYPPLREEIAERLNKRGITCTSENILITTGSQQALDVVCRASAVKSIATENPAYAIGKVLFEMNHMDVCSLPIDPFRGVDFDKWEEVLRENRPSLVYLTSSFQNPTGYSYSTSELQKIIQLSNEYKFGIVEDDWGSDMMSYSEYRPPLRSLGGDNVLYMNSFTKKLLPSLRIGYLLGNKDTIKSLTRAKWSSTLGNPTIIEAALFEFLSRGYFDGHLKKLHVEMDDKYRSCIEAMTDYLPRELRWTTPGGGPVLWLELPESVSLSNLKEDMLAQNINIDLCVDSFFGERHLHGIKIGFAFLPKEIMKNCIRILGDQIRKQL